MLSVHTMVKNVSAAFLAFHIIALNSVYFWLLQNGTYLCVYIRGMHNACHSFWGLFTVFSCSSSVRVFVCVRVFSARLYIEYITYRNIWITSLMLSVPAFLVILPSLPIVDGNGKKIIFFLLFQKKRRMCIFGCETCDYLSGKWFLSLCAIAVDTHTHEHNLKTHTKKPLKAFLSSFIYAYIVEQCDFSVLFDIYNANSIMAVTNIHTHARTLAMKPNIILGQ